jgi:hypothetical protein
MHWLRWLAQQMLARNQSVFLIEQIQPEWLSNRRQLHQYVLSDRLGWGSLTAISLLVGGWLLFWALGQAAAGVVLALACSLTAGLLVGLLSPLPVASDQRASRLRSSLVSALQSWLLIAPITGIVAALSAGWVFSDVSPVAVGVEVGSVCGMAGVFAGLLLGSPRLSPRRIIPTETVRWSWVQFRSHIGRAVIFGGLIGAVIHLVLHRFTNAYYIGAIEGVLMGMIVGIFAGIRGDVLEQQVHPNQGIRRSAQSAVITGAAATFLTIAIALVHGIMRTGPHIGLAGLLSETLGGIVAMSVVLGVGVGLGTAFARGGRAVLTHIALRFVLWRNKMIPWNYARFLDYCVACILLRKLGGGYTFMHRTLLEYFAALSDADLEQLATAARNEAR